MLAFGEYVSAQYRFDEADVVVLLDSDVLSCGTGSLRYARDFASRRRPDGARGMSRVYAAQEVHLSDGGHVTMTVGKEGVVLALGSNGLRQRLLMAERVVQEMRSGGRTPGIVFADNQAHPERVVVRMR